MGRSGTVHPPCGRQGQGTRYNHEKRMRRRGAGAIGGAFLLAILLIGCASEDPLSLAERLDLPRTGPTTMARVEGGYELRNRLLRVVIDETTGDVTYWGSADGEFNLLAPPGAVARLESTDAAAVGYIEKRDDQTWQYLGEDEANKLAWRKVYCLEGASLLVTYIVQNTGPASLRSSIVLRAEMPEHAGLRIVQPDLHEVDTDLGRVTLRGFRESPYEGSWPIAEGTSAMLISDDFLLRPGERYSFTTEWRLNPDLMRSDR